MASSAIIEWWVRLEGDQRDLADAAQSFQLNRICRVNLDGDGSYYLKSENLNALIDGNDVLAQARELVLRINGALKAQYSDYKPIEVGGGMITLHANGNRSVVVVPDSVVMTL